jgi:HSF-type DNA-binding
MKRIKVTEAELEDVELQESGKSSAMAQLKSMPKEDLEGDEDIVTVHGRAASPIIAAFDVAAAKPPPPPAPPELFAQSFPQRLMEMLDGAVVPDAMWWAEEGKAFAMDLSKFGDVLHHHFQATKYASFTRKLNKWYVSAYSIVVCVL